MERVAQNQEPFLFNAWKRCVAACVEHPTDSTPVASCERRGKGHCIVCSGYTKQWGFPPTLDEVQNSDETQNPIFGLVFPELESDEMAGVDSLCDQLSSVRIQWIQTPSLHGQSLLRRQKSMSIDVWIRSARDQWCSRDSGVTAGWERSLLQPRRR